MDPWGVETNTCFFGGQVVGAVHRKLTDAVQLQEWIHDGVFIYDTVLKLDATRT